MLLNNTKELIKTQTLILLLHLLLQNQHLQQLRNHLLQQLLQRQRIITIQPLRLILSDIVMIVEDQTQVLVEAIEVSMVVVVEITIIMPHPDLDWYLMQQRRNQSCLLMQILKWMNLWKCPLSYVAKNQLSNRNLHIVIYQVRYDLKLLQIMWLRQQLNRLL